MIDEPFAAGDSVIHRIDPRLKVILAVFFSAIIAVSKQFDSLVAALSLAILLVWLARLAFKEVIKRLLVVIGFLALLWLVLPLTFEGETAFRIGPVSIKTPGMILSAQISLKSVSILLLLMALIATINLATLGHALERLRVPNKIVYLLLMTYRYIFVIELEYQRLTRAAKIRGFQPGTNMHTYKTYAYLLGMLFVRATNRAERVFRAMQCRGFNGRYYCLSEFPVHSANWVFAAIMTILAVGLVIWEWTAH